MARICPECPPIALEQFHLAVDREHFLDKGAPEMEKLQGKPVKLMAGDVARAATEGELLPPYAGAVSERAAVGPAVTERAFEEYHLYTLERPATVLDREIKQVEFVRAANVPAERIYVYDGFKVDPRYRGWDYHSVRTRPEYGAESNPKVWVMLEFQNSEKSHLGMPLPRGKVKRGTPPDQL